MSFFGINKWHIETSLDMMNEQSTKEQIEKITDAKLDDMKVRVDEELKRIGKRKPYDFNIVITEQEWGDLIARASYEYKKLLLNWMQAYKQIEESRNKSRDHVTGDTTGKKAKLKDDVEKETILTINDGETIKIFDIDNKKGIWFTYGPDKVLGWFTGRYKKNGAEISEIEILQTNGKSEFVKLKDVKSFGYNETLEQKKESDILTLKDGESIKVKGNDIKAGQGLIYNTTEAGTFTGKYKKKGEEVSEIEIEIINSGKKGKEVFIKVGEIVSFSENSENPKENNGEENDVMPPVPPAGNGNPKEQERDSKERNNTLPTQQDIYDAYNAFLDTAKSIDSFGDLKTTKEKQDSKIILISNYNTLMSKINELLLSGKATKSDITYINKIKMKVAYYFAGELGVENEHWKDYKVSSQIALSILSSVKKPPERPNFLKVLSRLKGMGISSYIAQELAKGTSEKTIFENKLVNERTEEESKKLAKEYEKDLKRYLDSFDSKSLTVEQKLSINILREIEGTDGWKKSTWDMLKLGGIDIGAVGAGIGAGAIAGGEVGSIGFIPGAVVGTVVGGVVGGTVTTLGMMFNHGDNYFMDHWSVGLKELGINVGTFGLGGATIKVGNKLLRIAEEGSKIKRYGTLAGVTAGEAVIDVNIGAISDYLRNDGDVSYGNAIRNNLIWALLPIIYRGGTFSKMRKDLANKTADSLNRKTQIEALGREDLARQVEQKTDDEIRALRALEESEKHKEVLNTTKGKLDTIKPEDTDSILGLLKYDGNTLGSLKTYNNGIGLKYAEELQTILKSEGGKEKLANQVANIRRLYNQEVNRLGITESVGKQDVWIYWDIGKQLHLNKNPGLSSANYHLGDPFKDKQVIQDMIDRHLGWEIAKKEGLDLKHSYEFTNLGRERRLAENKSTGNGGESEGRLINKVSSYEDKSFKRLILEKIKKDGSITIKNKLGEQLSIKYDKHNKKYILNGDTNNPVREKDLLSRIDSSYKISFLDAENVAFTTKLAEGEEIVLQKKWGLPFTGNMKIVEKGEIYIKGIKITDENEIAKIMTNPNIREEILKRKFKKSFETPEFLQKLKDAEPIKGKGTALKEYSLKSIKDFFKIGLLQGAFTGYFVLVEILNTDAKSWSEETWNVVRNIAITLTIGKVVKIGHIVLKVGKDGGLEGFKLLKYAVKKTWKPVLIGGALIWILDTANDKISQNQRSENNQDDSENSRENPPETPQTESSPSLPQDNTNSEEPSATNTSDTEKQSTKQDKGKASQDSGKDDKNQVGDLSGMGGEEAMNS